MWTILAFTEKSAFCAQLSVYFQLSSSVQGHASDTYAEFVVENEERLKQLPPPLVALEYYKSGDLYYFDKLQTNPSDPKRRPECRYVCPALSACQV